MSMADTGSDTPPEGRIDSNLSGDTPSIQPGVDIRSDNLPITPPTPMGASYAIDVTEILRRGFRALDQDEQANVVAAYLATQKQQLSPFLTPFDEEIARSKLELEYAQNKNNTWFRIGSAIFLALVAVILLGFFIYIILKQGVLTDAGVLQGFMSTIQEVFRAIFSRNY